MSSSKRILTFSTLFPNQAQPRNGIFVETRLRHLLAHTDIESKVVAPVPWFPSTHSRFGRYAQFAAAPRKESRFDIDVYHPRYLTIPKVGMTMAPYLLALGALNTVRTLQRRGYEFDLIDAHYFYPDGVAATLLGRWLKKPVFITARGTDISLIPQYALPRRLIQWAAKECTGMIAVCSALKEGLVNLGADPDKVTVLRNGVDLDQFKPVPRELARNRTGIHGITLLSVGYLIERKGHGLIIEALAELPDVNLVIVGDGPLEGELIELAQHRGVSDRVRFVGAIDHGELPLYFSAADALVLASSREGMANVLLESIACGTPVIATNLWGTPEVVASPEAGLLIERNPQAIANAVRALSSAPPLTEATRAYAERFDWLSTTLGQERLFLNA